MELAYSIHLGSDKNKKNSVRVSAKTNKSGTTSMSNNSIQNAHNYLEWINIIIENMIMNKMIL